MVGKHVQSPVVCLAFERSPSGLHLLCARVLVSVSVLVRGRSSQACYRTWAQRSVLPQRMWLPPEGTHLPVCGHCHGILEKLGMCRPESAGEEMVPSNELGEHRGNSLRAGVQAPLHLGSVCWVLLYVCMHA